jgi:DNA-binding transcriptional LysR family regulator
MSDFDQVQIRKLDGGLLLIFHELMARRRASEAATHLGLSPSAVSHALGRLRDLFGEALFVRRSHGLEPTQRARELAPRIEELIALIGAAVSSGAAFDPARCRRRFREEAPLATFSTRYAILARALRAVRRGEADVALGAFRQIPAGLIARPLFDDDYCVIARRGHPIVRGSVDAATYASIGHLFVGNPDGALADEAPIDRAEMDDAYGELPGPERVRTFGYVMQWETAMLVVSADDVLAECPRRLALRYADKLGLQVLDPPYHPFRYTIQAVRRGEGADPGVDWLLAKLDEAVAG